MYMINNIPNKNLFLIRNSTSARIMYALMLLITTVVSCILLAPGLHDKLASVPFCKGDTDGDQSNGIQEQLTELVIGQNSPIPKYNCADAVGYLAVYRYVQYILFCS